MTAVASGSRKYYSNNDGKYTNGKNRTKWQKSKVKIKQ